MTFIEQNGLPLGFLHRGMANYRDGLSAVWLGDEPVPLDGRVYHCGGEIILRDGRRLPAQIELDTALDRPFVESHTWCTTDDGETWYRLDESELIDALAVKREEVFPVRWDPGRRLEHGDPGPYDSDWSSR